MTTAESVPRTGVIREHPQKRSTMDNDPGDSLAMPPEGQILIYHDGATRLQVRLEGRAVWLTQRLMAELYQTTPQNMTIHIRGIYEDGELDEAATCEELLQVQDEGGRRVAETCHDDVRPPLPSCPSRTSWFAFTTMSAKQEVG